MYIKVNRRNRPDCIVMLCKDRATKKWCYVNLSTEHVCSCRFDSINDAFFDMGKRADVTGFSVIDNPFAQKPTENTMRPFHSGMLGIYETCKKLERLCNHLRSEKHGGDSKENKADI